MARRRIIPYNPKLKQLARQLRNNSTQSEIRLWKELKGKQMRGYDFHRQKPLDNYIVDFFCHELMLAIELDGLSHGWEEIQERDRQKEERLNQLGIQLLRFEDAEVMHDLENVLRVINQYIEDWEEGTLPS